MTWILRAYHNARQQPIWLVSCFAVVSACNWGFGINWLTSASLATCWLAYAQSVDDKKEQALSIGMALILSLMPWLGMLHGVLMATIWLTTKHVGLSASPLALWAIEELPFEMETWPMNPWLRLALCAATFFLVSKNKRVAILLFAACVCLTLSDMSRATRFDSIEDYNDVGAGYKPGDVTSKTLGFESPLRPQGARPLRGYLHGSKISPDTPGVIMVEHDQWEGRSAEPIMRENQQVGVPWHSNCWPGRQYLRFAIAKDGFVSSNLGGALSDDGVVELCYLDQGKLRPVVVRRGSTTWTSESDFFNNALTAYNRWYVPEFNRQGLHFYWSRATNLLLASIAVFSLNAQLWLSGCILLSMGFTCLTGDIRISGGIGDPHDEGGPSGVPDMINSTGKVALPGQFGAKILIVPAGTSALHLGEKLVVLGGGSTLISLTNGVVRTADTPLGVVEGVEDAHHIMTTDATPKTPTAVLKDGTVVIGTSSPGRLKWKTLYVY
jgi:hypothetical protein